MVLKTSVTTLDDDLLARITDLVDETADRVVADRRDFHRYAEAGWTEFRTASLIARRLTDLGFDVAVGREAIDAAARMGVPDAETLVGHWERARAQGGDPHFLHRVRGGYTGVVGLLHGAEAPRAGAPTVGLRFDIDAVDVQESQSPDHRPAAEDFASINPGVAHACGHDGHAAIGLGVAQVLSHLQANLPGTVKLIFQPAEEGVRGAKSMVEAGVVDDVDAIVGLHLYSGWPTGRVAPGKSGFLATYKFDAFFTGEPAHAGGAPEQGSNALLAAATAVLNLHAIPRHREGPTRVNVGRLVAGQGRNVIPPTAHLVIETRGGTSEINDYMVASAMRILESAGAMYDCEVDVRPMGSADSADSDPVLMDRVAQVAGAIPELKVFPPRSGGGSEDYTYMMNRVQDRGGLATSIGFGADLGGWGHHTANFDIDEDALPLAVRLLTATTVDLLRDPPV